MSAGCFEFPGKSKSGVNSLKDAFRCFFYVIKLLFIGKVIVSQANAVM